MKPRAPARPPAPPRLPAPSSLAPACSNVRRQPLRLRSPLGLSAFQGRPDASRGPRLPRSRSRTRSRSVSLQAPPCSTSAAQPPHPTPHDPRPATPTPRAGHSRSFPSAVRSLTRKLPWMTGPNRPQKLLDVLQLPFCSLPFDLILKPSSLLCR